MTVPRSDHSSFDARNDRASWSHRTIHPRGLGGALLSVLGQAGARQDRRSSITTYCATRRLIHSVVQTEQHKLCPYGHGTAENLGRCRCCASPPAPPVSAKMPIARRLPQKGQTAARVFAAITCIGADGGRSTIRKARYRIRRLYLAGALSSC